MKTGLALLLAITLSFVDNQAWAAIGTPVDTGGNSAAGTSVGLTMSATCPGGNALFVAGRANVDLSATSPTVTDTHGNTYTQVYHNWNVANSLYASLFRADNITQVSSGDVVTFNSGAFAGLTTGATCVSGLSTTPTDVVSTVNTQTFGATVSTPATGTLAQAVELLVADNAVGSTGTAATPVCTGPFAVFGAFHNDTAGAPHVWWCYEIVASTATQTATLTWTNNFVATAEISTYKGASGGGPTSVPNGLKMLGVGH